MHEPSPATPPPPPRPPHGRLSMTLRAALGFLVIAPLSALYFALCVLLLPWRSLRIRVGNAYGKTVGRWVLFMVQIRPVVLHRERLHLARPALYVCNHASTADMWAGMWLCPFGGCGVAKKEIVRVPFFGQAYFLSGHLLVDRGNLDKAIASMKEAAEVVRRHHLSLWMWPEGTRSRDGRLQPLKKGFVHLALATGLSVVPVVIHDGDLLWRRGMRVVPGPLRIEVLEPVDTSGWRMETADRHAQEVWSRLQSALGPRQRGTPPSGLELG